MPELKRFSYKHEAIADWLIANPEKSLGECARAFGVTQSWMSCIVNSKLFRAHYGEKSKEYFDSRVVPLRDRMLGIAARAADKLEASVETSTDERFHLDVVDRLTQRAGYGARADGGRGSGGGPTFMQFNSVSPEVLERARRNFEQRAMLPSPSTDDEDDDGAEEAEL